MVNMTLSVPEEIHKEMSMHTEIRWSDVARQAFERKIRELHWMDKLTENSKLTEKDIERVGHKVERAVFQRLERESQR